MAHSFSLSPWSPGSIFGGPVARQNIITERAQWSKAAELMTAEKQKEGRGQKLPTFCFTPLPNNAIKLSSINRLIY